MSQGYLIGLDAGGGSGRCLVLDVETGAVTVSMRPWTHATARGTGSLGRDLDLDLIWAELAATTRDALARAGAVPEQVLGVAATSMRLSLVVVDADGRPILAGPNADARAAGEALRLAVARGAALFPRSGHWMNPVLGLPRLLWAKANLGSAWSRAGAIMSLGDWVAFRLCGEVATDPSQAAASALLDVARREWADDLIADFELPRGLFPELRASGTSLGSLGADAARSLGLAAGTPVAVAGADTQCGLLGAGAAMPGDVGIVAGTTTPLQMVLDAPTLDAEGRLWTEPFLMEDRWVLESNAGPMGDSLEWFAGVLYPDAPAPVARLFGEAARSEVGARGLSSTLGGEVMNARELGLPVANLSMSHMTSQGDPEARRHLARAAAESAAHTMRANLEQIVEVVGREAGSLTLAGGLSRSETLARIAASVFGRSLGVASTPEASALGAAFCAGVAVGVWPDLESAARHARARVHEVAAEPDATARYADLHSGWRAQRIAQSEADTLARNRFMAAALVAPVAGEGAAFAPPPRPRILVTAALDDESLAALQALGDVEYASYREAMRLLTGDSLVAALDGVDVFITEIDVVDAGAMLRARDLKVVASCRGDAVNVDAVAARALRIPVLNAPGRNADAVADLAVGFLLMLARKLAGANAFLREPGGKAGDMGRMGRAFNAFQGRELWQKTIGLVGLGAVGRGVARRLDGFGARVVVHDPFLSAEQAALANTELVSLATLLAESDYVSLHAPVSDATRHLIGAAEFAAMKSGACLVNTARAALVDEAALVASLESGHLAGAALDVFSEEPPASSHPLLQMEQVVATPHIGGNTVEVAAHQGRIIADDLARLLRGQAPLHALDVEVADHFDWGAARPELSPAQVAELEHRPGPAVTDLQKDKRADAPGKPSEAVTREAGPAAPADLVESMQAILVGFCQRISNDAALNALAADKDVTLFFTLSDLGLRFWVRLRGGGIRAEPGTPDGEPEVNLKLAAEVFDGMFTGSANPMQAAMDGRLSFTGDTAKAMTLQELQGDLARLYCEARAATGGPGDLSALATEPESTAPMVSAAAALPGRPRVGDVRDELCDIIDELFAQQVITATGGNVSVRVPGQDELWITPSQLFKGDLGPEVLVRIDLEGKALDERARAASSERLIHCAVYANRPQANAVIHAHAPHATILANAGLAFLPVSTEAAFFGDIPRVPFIMPGTAALAEAIGAAAADSWAVLMVNHGLLVGGRSLRRAADMVEIIERSCEIILGCLQVGKQPPVLPDDIVAKLREMGDLIA